MDLTIHGTAVEMIQNQMKSGEYQSAEDVVYDALEALANKQLSDNIDKGLADIEAGRYMEVTPDNIKDVLAKPLSQWPE